MSKYHKLFGIITSEKFRSIGTVCSMVSILLKLQVMSVFEKRIHSPVTKWKVLGDSTNRYQCSNINTLEFAADRIINVFETNVFYLKKVSSAVYFNMILENGYNILSTRYRDKISFS